MKQTQPLRLSLTLQKIMEMLPDKVFPGSKDLRGIFWLGGSDGKESACNSGDLGSVPGLERSPGGGLGNPLQYSCLEQSMDRGAWRATVCGVTVSQTRLSE